MIKKIVVSILVIGALSFGAWQGWQKYQEHKLTQAAERELSITAYGNVDIREVALAFRIDGRLAELSFEEGDTVKSGDLAGILDSEPFREEVTLREAELTAARADLSRLEAGYRPQEIVAARAALAEREATLATLQAEFDRLRSLVNIGAVSRQSFDDVQARRAEAEARIQSARAELALRVEGFRQEDIAQARAQVASRVAQLEIARTRLADTKLYVPSPGVVMTRILEPGSIVRSGEAVLTVSLTDPVWIRAYIPEPDLGRIFPGMNVHIYTDSCPDQAYEGQVGFISPEAEFTPRSVETTDMRTRLVYRLRITVNNPDNGLRQGMPVTVKFPLARETDLRTEAMPEEE